MCGVAARDKAEQIARSSHGPRVSPRARDSDAIRLALRSEALRDELTVKHVSRGEAIVDRDEPDASTVRRFLIAAADARDAPPAVRERAGGHRDRGDCVPG